MSMYQILKNKIAGRMDNIQYQLYNKIYKSSADPNQSIYIL